MVFGNVGTLHSARLLNCSAPLLSGSDLKAPREPDAVLRFRFAPEQVVPGFTQQRVSEFFGSNQSPKRLNWAVFSLSECMRLRPANFEHGIFLVLKLYI
jgi:hypothetical protein